VAIGVTLTAAACSSGSTSPTVASVGTDPTTTASPASASSAGGATPLAQGLAYSKCMRSHSVPSFPDPVETPSGGYGYHFQLGPNQIDPNAPSYVTAGDACKSLAPEWWIGKPLTPADEQAWLTWATCIRAKGLPSFPDPTFAGGRVAIDDGGHGPSPQLQAAMQSCKSQMPSNGGVGG
jgi:hypothetical protein